MPLHFSTEELAERRAITCSELKERGLSGLLMFRQESMYYLTGYDTFGYVFFQCLYLGADGRLMLLTRSVDVRTAAYTSMIGDVRMWVDRADAAPASELRAILDEFGLRGETLGVEWDAYGLTAANGRQPRRGPRRLLPAGRRVGPRHPPARGEASGRNPLCPQGGANSPTARSPRRCR